MATRSATTIKTQIHPFTLVIEWTGLLLTDVASWELLSHYKDKWIHVYGEYGGAIVTLEGTSEGSGLGAPNPSVYPVPLSDHLQTELAFTSNAIKYVLENPLYIRPKVSGGDGTTSLTVRLVCRH